MHIDLIKPRIFGFWVFVCAHQKSQVQKAISCQNGSIDFRNDFNRMINKIFKVLFD